jgi:hypothetical protein
MEHNTGNREEQEMEMGSWEHAVAYTEQQTQRKAEARVHHLIGQTRKVKTGPNSFVEGRVAVAKVLGTTWAGRTCYPWLELTLICGPLQQVRVVNVKIDRF